VTEAETIEMEQAIAACVREFYGKARKDPEIGPIFNNVVDDWDVHLRVVSNFWSKVLLQTERYSGHPYVAHVKLPIEIEHFDIWLKMFVETAKQYLPPEYAEKAAAKAHHMAESFRSGLFPFQDHEGKPSRHPV
jgi:hemoglobin